MNDLIARISPEEMELMKKASCGLKGKTLNYRDVISLCSDFTSSSGHYLPWT